MSAHSTFKIGGAADCFVRPNNAEEAARLVAAASEEGQSLFVIGGGANILVGDKGIRGIVLDTSGIREIHVERESATGAEAPAALVAGSGLAIDELCLDALAAGLGGLENFFGMPGSVGGAAYMNARCYDTEMSQVLAWVESCDKLGRITRRQVPGASDGAGGSPAGWAYKLSPYQAGGGASVAGGAGELILGAGFRLTRLSDEQAAAVAATMRSRRADREAKGHYRLPSAGSVFKNDRGLGAPTGKLLDSLGLRGRRIGDAMVSSWHANIFVNAGAATAADMRSLIELAQAEALEKLGARLECEVVFAGEF